MIQIRKNVFETNSSSVHTICIAKNYDYTNNIPKNITFRVGEYGWGYDCLSCLSERASYLYTAILYTALMYDKDTIFNMEHVIDVLSNIGINCTVIEPGEYEDFYIDHCGELHDWLDTIFNNDTLLLNYLLCDSSHVIIDNDNKYYEDEDYEDEDEINTDDYYMFVKSN